MSYPLNIHNLSSKRQILHGSIWTMGLRWTIRLMGLASTIILARLLTPADYGIVSIAALIVGLVDMFSQTGQYSAIIRHPEPTREHYDSAWTVSLLLGFGLGVIIWATIPLTSIYFHEPRAGTVAGILALGTMMSGCVNIGIVNFKRNLEFRRQFLFTLYPRIFSTAITVILAFVLRNYWALVIGILSQSALTLILSYVMEPFRPRIAFSKIREIWSFSIWTLFKGIGGYVHSQIDKLAIGNFAGASGMGRYDVAQDVATSPTQELVTPLITSLMPVMAKVQNDKRARRALYLNVLNWSAVICTSTSIGVALVSRDMAGVLLGPAWSDVGVLMPWFALSWGLLGMSNSVYSVLDTIGRPVISARLQWMRVIVLGAAIVPVARSYGSLEAVVITRFVVTAAVTPTLFYALSLALEVPMRDFVLAIWRPAVAGLVMALVVLTINAGFHFIGSPRLLLDIAAGAIAYASSLMLLWGFVGRPEGVESDIWQLVRNFILRRYGNRREIIGSTPQPSDDIS